MPECGIGLNEVYSLTDILHILKVSPESKLYNELVIRKPLFINLFKIMLNKT